MFEMPGYQTLDVIHTNGDIQLFRLSRSIDGMCVLAKTTRDTGPESAMVAAFRYEYDVLKKLDGRGALEAYSLEMIADRPVLLLKEMAGVTLEQLLRAYSDVTELPDLLRMAVAITDCLIRIHRENMTLNEITPSHLMVNPRTYEAKLIDIRMCSTEAGKSPLSSLSRPDAFLPYISPEQTRRTGMTPDYRSDFYSLGIILYEWLSGTLPFEHIDPVNTVYRHLAGTPEPLHRKFPFIPKIVSDIIQKCMEKMPDDRYVSAFGIQTDLEECFNRLQVTGEVEPFRLGSRDIPERWVESAQFYGRQAELQMLQDAVRRAANGSVVLVGVSGTEGIGKTSFLMEALEQAASMDYFFIRGKFGTHQTAQPYDIWIQVIRKLIRQLLTEGKLQAEVWKLRILQAVEDYGKILIERVPELELLIGQQPPVQPLPPVEAQERFHLIMNRFIQLFLRPNCPLVLFLDDLQWADEASLRYLEFLLDDRATKHLLVALAYRDQDADPIRRLENRLTHDRIIRNRIDLQPLALEDINQLLKDVMRHKDGDVEELAVALLRKTDGNPFFLKQFLGDLIAHGHVFFDPSSKSWSWDLPFIAEMNIPDNAVSYLTDRLQVMPPSTKIVVGYASFLGSRFDLETLSIISGLHITKLAKELEMAERMSLVQLINDGSRSSYKFQHDRIQQVAYTLVPEEERSELHWSIGLLFLDRMNLDQGEGTEALFEAVNHMNLAGEGNRQPEQRTRMAELNLRAGLKAKESTAYETALRYMRLATAYLEADGDNWGTNYGLAFQANRERAELEYLCAHFQLAHDLFQSLMEKAVTPLDKASVCVLKMHLKASQDHYGEVISLGQDALRLLQVDFPSDFGSFGLTLQWLRLKRKLGKYSMKELDQLPPMTDASRQLAISALVHMSNASFYVNRKGWLSYTLTIVDMTLRYGMTPEASIGFMGYALFMYYRFRHEEAFKWGMLAYRLSKPYPQLHVRTLTAFTLCSDSWRRYDPALLGVFTEKAGKIGLESGDLWQGNQSVLINCGSLLQFGHPLGEIYDRLIASSGNILRHHNHLHSKQLKVFIALLIRLTGVRSPDDPFDTGQITDAEFAESVHGDSFHVIEELVCIYRYLPGYLFGEYREANEALARSAVILEKRKTAGDPILQYYYESLVWAKLYEEAPMEVQNDYMGKLRKRLSKMKEYAIRCPENYQHKYLLMKAEIFRLMRRNRQAEELYEQSIEAARQYGHIHDMAMAAECYGKYGLRQGKPRLARIYMAEAYEAYVQWGALAKAAVLKQEHPHLLQLRPESGLERVDTLSVMMSAQALSGEMEMSRLLDSLMRIMLHNAGAEYGAVIFDDEGKWTIEAWGTSADIRIESVPLGEESEIVPAPIVGYAARTQEVIVLHDASNEGMFVRNTYVRNKGLKSVLCLPIIHQNQLTCVLYMENKLSRSIFTPQRLDILKLLGSQCAISIKNAKLYTGIQYLKENLELQVEERTRSLERSMRETSAAQAEASVYEERNRIAQEIHDIVGHTLTSTILQIEAGKRLLHKDMQAGVQRLNEAQDLVRHSLNEIRGSVHMLREDKYAHLPNMLQGLIRDTERNAGVTIHASIHDLPEWLSTACKKTIYHALQEGLTNGIRHGGSKVFHFNLMLVGSELEFRLQDQGIGARTIVNGFGLKTMRERVEQLGGSLTVDSRPGQGCLLRINLPYQKQWIGEKEWKKSRL